MPQFASVQMEPKLLEPEINLEKIALLIHEAAARGAEVAVFPECAITGYALSAREAAEVASPIPGPHTQHLAEVVQQAGLTAVLVGTIEVDTEDRLFNTAALVGPEGLIARYRKTHLPFLGVDRYLAAGDVLPDPFDTPAGRLGALICYDIRFPEPARSLALAGAQVVLISTAWPRAASLYPEFVVQTRAAENGVYIVAANRIGEERGTHYLGRSLIVGPDGEMLAEASPDAEEILCVEIDLARSDDKRRVFVPNEYELSLFDDRRPELYRSLASE